jgi:hypothetical protein
MNGIPAAPYLGDNSRIMATTGIQENNGESSAALSVFPNPVTDVMEIKYINGKAGDVKITITDILGRDIGTLESGYKDAGENTLRFDLGNLGLTNGVYFVNVDANGEKSQQKIIYSKN